MPAFANVKCDLCGTIFEKENRRVNESLKRGWNIFCSKKCQNQAKTKRRLFNCGNHKCDKTFMREPSEVSPSGICFCSRSCAVSVNNSKYPKRNAIVRSCPNCKGSFTGERKYCSKKCLYDATHISKEKIIEEVSLFFRKNGRIPLKREFYNARAARIRFGSWNKAIVAAGFKPNPVKFAEKHVANDGHPCDSVAEKVIDDWLSARNIKHEVKVPYGKNNMTADFKINDILIEFFGLSGESKSYDRLVRAKKKLWKEKNLKVIEIYPRDLFPKNKLGEVFGAM